MTSDPEYIYLTSRFQSQREAYRRDARAKYAEQLGSATNHSPHSTDHSKPKSLKLDYPNLSRVDQEKWLKLARTTNTWSGSNEMVVAVHLFRM